MNEAQRSRELLSPNPIPTEPLDLPVCDIKDCDDAAPFSIHTKAGDVHRCRNCLRKDLAADWWRFK